MRRGGTAGEAYLAGRGLQVRHADLLFHPDLTYWDTRTGYPALIAIVRNAAGERSPSTAPIWRRTARAKPIPPRMMLGSVAGGAVRLGGVGEHGVVGLGEGIETALSVMQACRRCRSGRRSPRATWSRSSCREVTRVVLLADHDGEESASRSPSVPPVGSMPKGGGLDRPSTGRRRRLQRPVAEAGRDAVRQVVEPRPNGSRATAASTAIQRPPELGTHRALGFPRRGRRFQIRAPTMATSPGSPIAPGACCSLQHAALALPLRRRAVLGRAGQRWAAGAAPMTEDRLRHVLAQLVNWRKRARTATWCRPTRPRCS